MKNSRRNFIKKTAFGVSSISALSFASKSKDNQSLDSISSLLNILSLFHIMIIHYDIFIKLLIYYSGLFMYGPWARAQGPRPEGPGSARPTHGQP